LLIVFAFVGDSTITSDFAMWTPDSQPFPYHPYQI
jgi:hypothetical protein